MGLSASLGEAIFTTVMYIFHTLVTNGSRLRYVAVLITNYGMNQCIKNVAIPYKLSSLSSRFKTRSLPAEV